MTTWQKCKNNDAWSLEFGIHNIQSEPPNPNPTTSTSLDCPCPSWGVGNEYIDGWCCDVKSRGMAWGWYYWIWINHSNHNMLRQHGCQCWISSYFIMIYYVNLMFSNVECIHGSCSHGVHGVYYYSIQNAHCALTLIHSETRWSQHWWSRWSMMISVVES